MRRLLPGQARRSVCMRNGSDAKRRKGGSLADMCNDGGAGKSSSMVKQGICGALSCTPIYAVEPQLSVEEFRRLLIDSGLGARRPTDDPDRIEQMIKNANLVVTARIGGVLVGAARSITDFAFCCYLSDLAVSLDAQRQGIGEQLIRETRRHLGPSVSLILSAVPEAVSFYERIDMPRLTDCFWYRREI